MKKILLLTAIIASALSYGASVKWSIGSYTFNDKAGTALSSGIAYLVSAETSAEAPKVTSSTVATWIAQFSGSNSALITNGAATAMDGVSSAGNLYASNADLALNGTYNFYLLVFDNADATKAKNYLLSDATPGTIVSMGGPTDQDTLAVKFGGKGTVNMNNATWQTIPTTVPEPTALALLALGVAGLALRRRA